MFEEGKKSQQTRKDETKCLKKIKWLFAFSTRKHPNDNLHQKRVFNQIMMSSFGLAFFSPDLIKYKLMHCLFNHLHLFDLTMRGTKEEFTFDQLAT